LVSYPPQQWCNSSRSIENRRAPRGIPTPMISRRPNEQQALIHQIKPGTATSSRWARAAAAPCGQSYSAASVTTLCTTARSRL
jgi:hypothetical protein